MSLGRQTTSTSPAVRSFEAQWRARSADALWPVREQAMQRFLKLGMPSPRDETWRYTDLRSLASQSFVEAPHKAPGEVQPEATQPLLDGSHATLLMVNGYPSLPPDAAGINGIEIKSIRDISLLDPSILLRFLPPPSDADQRRWVLLNTALFRDGLYLKITRPLTAPLLILHVSTGDGANDVAHPRVIIDACPRSE